MTRALVLYHSLYGNTKAVATSLANGIEESGIETDCLSIDEVDISQIKKYDFLAGEARYKRSLSNDQKRLIWLKLQKRSLLFKLEKILRKAGRYIRRKDDSLEF